MDPDKRAKMALPSRTNTNHLQHHMVPDNRLLTLLSNVWALTEITSGPVIPWTVRRDENSQTTDEYVMFLYDKLKIALALARDTTLLEAQRQKRHYDRKAGAVELHLGDKVASQTRLL